MKELLYLVDISQMKDNTTPTSIVAYSAETEEQREAVWSAFYSTMASKYANADVVYGCTEILSVTGAVVKHDEINRSVQTPEENNEDNNKENN